MLSLLLCFCCYSVSAGAVAFVAAHHLFFLCSFIHHGSLIDFHPHNENVILASPCSGHGFKVKDFYFCTRNVIH